MTLPSETEDVESVYHLYVVRVAAEHRDRLIGYLKEKGISAGVHYPIALPLLDAYNYMQHSQDDFPYAVRLSLECVSLPIFPEMKEEQIRYVADTIKEYFVQ